MKSKLILSILCTFSLISNNALANWQQELNWRHAAAGVGALFAGSMLYKWWTKEPSREELYENAKQAYDRHTTKYGSMSLLHRIPLLQKKSLNEDELHGLAKGRDIRLVRDIPTDIKQLERHIQMLSRRIKKDAQGGLLEDYDLIGLRNQLVNFKEKLQKASAFVSQHKTYFDLHLQLDAIREQFADLKTLNQLYDRYVARGIATLHTIGQEAQAALARLGRIRNAQFPRITRAAKDWKDDLEQIIRNTHALKAFAALDSTFKEHDTFARKLSFRDSFDLAARVRSLNVKDVYPFKHAAEKAQEAVQSLTQELHAVDQHAILFNSDDGFSARACDLVKRSQELHAFLATLPDAITRLPEYAQDLEKERADKQHAEEVALREKEIQLEHEREQERIRIEQERLAAEKAHAHAEQKARQAEREQAMALEKERLQLEREKLAKETDSEAAEKDAPAHAVRKEDPYSQDRN